MHRTTKLLLLLLAIGLVAAGSTAIAAIPGSSGTISGCYDKQSGQLRLTDPATNQPKGCTTKENPISWNQKGVSHAFHVTDESKEITDTTLSYPSSVIAEQDLGPGTYMVTADLQLTSYTLPSVPLEVVKCALGVSFTSPNAGSGGRFDYGRGTVWADNTGDLIAGSVSLSERLTVPAGGTGKAAVSCWAPHPVYADNVDLWALELDSIG